MKTYLYFLPFILFFGFFCILPLLFFKRKDIPDLEEESKKNFNDLLKNQLSIDFINKKRPKIYLYTDFGGGTNGNRLVQDLQTCGEIASSGWKSSLHQEIYVNDSAKPLCPEEAAVRLAATFPFKDHVELPFHSIVIHVIDPGVGNESKGKQSHPRSIVLRKDGFLFIGPDNGTLSYACPADSIAGIWEIDPFLLNKVTGIDVEAGGTFHGRDLFCEAAFRIASLEIRIEEIARSYPVKQLRILFDQCGPEQKLESIQFQKVATDRLYFIDESQNDQELFQNSFLLGVIQSPLYHENVTKSKKIFITSSVVSDKIAIVNEKTRNIYIGPNNGLGTSFFHGFPKNFIKAFQMEESILEKIIQERNNETAYEIILKQKLLNDDLKSLDFLGDESHLVKDLKGRPIFIQGRIWIDLYGNIKTTIKNKFLDIPKSQKAKIRVSLNEIEKTTILADSFSEVPQNQLFIYNGSSGVLGDNPHRSERYVELTANGIFNKFGIDFFVKEDQTPKSGELINLTFEYED